MGGPVRCGSAPRFTRPHPLVWRKNDEQDAARIDAYLGDYEVSKKEY
jgi:hypothetical protein